LRTGQPPQRDFASATLISSSEKKSSGSALWHGKVKAMALSYVPVTSPRPIFSPLSAQPGISSSLKRTLIVLTFFLLSSSFFLFVGYRGKQKGPESFVDSRPLASSSFRIIEKNSKWLNPLHKKRRKTLALMR
jgi:hypothetical protein